MRGERPRITRADGHKDNHSGNEDSWRGGAHLSRCEKSQKSERKKNPSCPGTLLCMLAINTCAHVYIRRRVCPAYPVCVCMCIILFPPLLCARCNNNKKIKKINKKNAVDESSPRGVEY